MISNRAVKQAFAQGSHENWVTKSQTLKEWFSELSEPIWIIFEVCNTEIINFSMVWLSICVNDYDWSGIWDHCSKALIFCFHLSIANPMFSLNVWIHKLLSHCAITRPQGCLAAIQIYMTVDSGQQWILLASTIPLRDNSMQGFLAA